MELEVGTVFLRKYVIDRLVGQGSMGRVYEARDQGLDRRVAIRLIDPEYDNERVSAFNENDATVVGRLGNRHLTELVSIGILPSGERCVISEFVAGETLQRRMARLGRMSQLGVTQLLGQLLKGLGAAQQAGVCHRDLTPRSIFIAPALPGPGHIARIVDFGITRLAILKANPSSFLASNDADRNSFQYLSPEQLNGLREPDSRSNIYTLGIIAYEAITGRLPFDGKDFASLASSILLEEPKPISELAPEASQPLIDLIGRAMARSPNARFQSAEELSAAIASFTERVSGFYSGLESKPPPGQGRDAPASVSRDQVSAAPVPATAGAMVAAANSSPIAAAAPQDAPPPMATADDDAPPIAAAPIAAAAPQDAPPPPPPPPPPIETADDDPTVAIALQYPAPPPPPPMDVADEAPTVAVAPKYPAPAPMHAADEAPVVAALPRYPAPPPMTGESPVIATAPRYPAPPGLATVERTDPGSSDSGFRPHQATSPGIHPSSGRTPIAAQLAALGVEPAIQAQLAAVVPPAAVVEPAEPSAAVVPPAVEAEPATRVHSEDAAESAAPPLEPSPVQAKPAPPPFEPPPVQAKRAAPPFEPPPVQAKPAPPVEPVSNVRQRVEVAATDGLDELGPYDIPATRSRKPLIVAMLLLGLAGAGIAFILFPGRQDTTGKDVASATAPSAAVADTARVVPTTVPTAAAATATSQVAPSAAPAPLPSAEIPLVAAVARATQPKSQPPLRAVQSTKKPAPATPAAPATPSKKPTTAKRDSAKDPYNYR